MGSGDAFPLLIIALIVLAVFGFVEFGIKATGKSFQDESSAYQEATIVNPVVDHMLFDDVSCGETKVVYNLEN